MNEFDETARRLRETPGLETGRGATEAEIREAEAMIGALPSDYRDFLREFGWAAFGPSEVAGLGDAPHRWLNVVTVTLSERAEGGLSESMATFYNDGGGNLFCFYTGPDADDEPTVYCLEHEQRHLIREHASFTEFLEECIQRAIESPA